MNDISNAKHIGPIYVMPGVSTVNIVTVLYAGFITISMLTGINFLQGYILTQHLDIPRGEQGTISGDLAFWTEVITIALFVPFGTLSDRIGRRPVYVIGLLFVCLGYGLYPFAESVTELLIYRTIFAVGVAAAATMLAAVQNDYPTERSRGKLIGITGTMNVLGVIFMAGGISRIPNLLAEQGYDPVTAGQVMFLIPTALCLLSVGILQMGLKGGTSVKKEDQKDTKTLLLSGLKAAKNPRIALSYAGAFAARADFILKGLFLSLWVIHTGAQEGMNPAQSMARFATIIIVMQISGLIWSPLFGWIMDRVNRVTAAIIVLIFASLGYTSMGIITSPLDFAMMPFFIILTLGTSGMVVASLGLIGQEAAPAERGSVIAMNSLFGAIGILVLTWGGGRIFDSIGPSAPFVVAGLVQGVLLIAAIIIRIVSPGETVIEPGRGLFQKPADAKGATIVSSGTTGSN